jgi:hypothetical protein
MWERLSKLNLELFESGGGGSKWGPSPANSISILQLRRAAVISSVPSFPRFPVPRFLVSPEVSAGMPPLN